MARQSRTEQLSELGRKALEKALSELPPINEKMAVMTGMDGQAVVVEYFIVGKRPEDGVLVARARIDRATGSIVSVETFWPRLQ